MSALSDPENLVIFTTSPTGLGHIRVMDALIHGLTLSDDYLVMGVHDVNAAKIHALGSRIPILLKFTEFLQEHNIPEMIVSKAYKYYFSRKTKDLVRELTRIAHKYPKKKRWVVVCTHFALSYPAIAVRSKLERELGVKITIAVIVTDDSPQRIWAADGADIIFAPSDSTAKTLKSFLSPNSKTQVEIVSFPISPRLSARLTEPEMELTEGQLDPNSKVSTHISIPISGAAVQLPYMQSLIRALSAKKYIFTVIGQVTEYTYDFFESVKKMPRVQVSTGATAKETVTLYASSFYQSLRPAIEITKPSEQTFKALLKPNERGGVILLLTAPVGRQERDNLNFLRRHDLMPSSDEEEIVNEFLLEGKIREDTKSTIFYRASHWRALRLPDDPDDAAVFLENARREGLLYTMLSYLPEMNDALTGTGVAQIWRKIDEKLRYG